MARARAGYPSATMASAVDSCWQRAQARLETDGADAAWDELHPLRETIASDRDAARVWLTMLRITPGRAGLVADATGIADVFGDDPQLALLACDALVRAAELLPIDVPPAEKGAAMGAVHVAQGALGRLTDAQRADAQIKGYLQINLANGLRLGHLYDRALAAYKAAPHHGTRQRRVVVQPRLAPQGPR